MTGRKMIAISMRTTLSRDGEVRDEVSESLVMFIARAGFLPIIVPNCPSVAIQLMDQASGLVLSGGGEQVSASKFVESRRQETERALLEFAIAGRIPTLGICRGAQVINVYFGGTVRILTPPVQHVATEHPVRINPSWTASLFDPFMLLTVNSFHQYGIARVGPSLLVAATAPDHQVEAIEHVSHPIIGLMWHPERGCGAAEFDKAHTNLLQRLMIWPGANR